MALWKPSDWGSTALRLWLDAQDNSTLTLSGSNVSGWADKSGNANNASQATAASQPVLTSSALGSYQALVTTGGGQKMALTSALTNTMLYTQNTNADQSQLNVGGVNTNNSTITHFVTGVPHLQEALWNSTTQFWYETGNSLGTTSTAVSGAGGVFWVGQPASSGGGTFGRMIGEGPTVFGRAADGLRGFDGKFGEILYYNNGTLPTSVDRLKAEGYLAWKWGITSRLPVGHAYASAPPNIVRIVQNVNNGTAATSTTTSSFTPTAGNLLLAFVSVRHSSISPGALTISDSLGGTWTAVTTDHVYNPSNPSHAVNAYVQVAGSGGAMTVTGGANPGTMSYISVFELEGASTSTPTNFAFGDSTTGDPSCTLPTALTLDSSVFGVHTSNGGNAISPPTGYTEVYENTTSGRFEVAYNYSPDSTTIAWNTAQVNAVGMVVEIVPSTGGGSTGSGAASGSMNLSGAAVGASTAEGLAAGAAAFTGAAVGASTAAAVASGSMAFSGAAAASGASTASAVAAGAMALSGAATGAATSAAVASGSVALTGAATSNTIVSSVASGAMSFTGAASAPQTITAVASGSITFTGDAAGRNASATNRGDDAFPAKKRRWIDGRPNFLKPEVAPFVEAQAKIIERQPTRAKAEKAVARAVEKAVARGLLAEEEAVEVRAEASYDIAAAWNALVEEMDRSARIRAAMKAAQDDEDDLELLLMAL